MTAAEQVARALRESECVLLDCESCKNLEPCPTNIALAEFVEAAEKASAALARIGSAAGPWTALDARRIKAFALHADLDAALKRLAEVMR